MTTEPTTINDRAATWEQTGATTGILRGSIEEPGGQIFDFCEKLSLPNGLPNCGFFYRREVTIEPNHGEIDGFLAPISLREGGAAVDAFEFVDFSYDD